MQKGIESILENLNLTTENPGTSIGSKWLSENSDFIASYSPVDGKLIGKVKQTSAKEFETVVSTAEKAFKIWRKV